VNAAYSISRSDRAWYPRSELRPALYSVPHRGGRRHSPAWRPGLGQSNTQLAQQATGAAATAATTAASLLASIGTISAATVPLVGAVVAAGTLLASILIKEFSGCGQSCTLTSDAANQIGDALSKNVEAYLAIPNGQRTKSIQAAALANFDNTWAKLVQYCGNPSFGSAGQRCTQDRQQGACKWKSSPGGWQKQNGDWIYVWPGPAGSGNSCWNYFVGMRDPIANDPAVVADTVPGAAAQVSSAVNQMFGGSGSSTTVNMKPLLLIGGLGLLAWALL